MIIRLSIILSFAFLLTCLMVIPDVHAETRRLRSPLKIEIKLKKDTYREFEPIKGEVLIKNSRPATFPVNFTVRLFRNGEFYRRSIVNTPIFSGRNELDIDTFAKDVFKGPHAVAVWRMEISTEGDHPVGAACNFRIVSDDFFEKPVKRSKYIYSPSSAGKNPKVPRERGVKSIPEPRIETEEIAPKKGQIKVISIP